MIFLIDTNVLVRLEDSLDPRHVEALGADLVSMNQVRGKTAHDARLVAAMERHGLTNLLAFNPADFARFFLIHVYTPADILNGKLPS